MLKKNRSNSNIPSSFKLNEHIASCDRDSAELFSTYFSSVYSSQKVTFSVNDVFDKLSSLRGVRSIGPDGLSGDFLFHLRSVISYPLWLLFRSSLDEGIYPSILKFSSVIPIFKSGDPSSVLNYRPISIQSHISKILESLVLNDIRRSINPIIIEELHGFHPGRSTVTCNLFFNNFIFNSFQQRSQVDGIHTDFHKAFDSVNHDVLIQILKASGFGEPLLSWFKSFLVDRYQWVSLFNFKSTLYLALVTNTLHYLYKHHR